MMTRLEESFSIWMEAAMREYPWTLNVDIINGGGSQILAESVELWIREKRTVAKRFLLK
jgi:hypothetical protein